MSIEYIEKNGVVITTVGQARGSFPGGKPVTVKMFDGKEVPGVNVSVKFDFDSETWYSGNFTDKAMKDFIVKGKSVNIKTWAKESGGKTYHNFAIVYPKKGGDTSALEAKLNPLIPTIERQGKQIMSLYAEVKAIKELLSKKETTTMFDTNAKDVFPEEFDALYTDEQPPLSAYDDSEMNPNEIPF